VLICTGTIITVYGKSGRAVQVSSSDAVVLSADRQGATAFELVVCLASDTSAVSEAIRPTCVSLMDARRPDWYVRLRNSFLHVDPKNSTVNLPLFKLDSSFIVHPNTFHQGKYALESVNYRRHYISSQADRRFKIVQKNEITNRHDASFSVSNFIIPSKCHRSVCSAAGYLVLSCWSLVCNHFLSKLYKKRLQTKDQQDETKYKQYKRTFRKIALEAEEKYYREMFDTRTSCVEKPWRNLNTVYSLQKSNCTTDNIS